MINVDAYPFLACSDLTCHLENTGIAIFWLTVLLDNRETKLGSNDQEASPPAGKDSGVVLVQCCALKCVPAAISSGVDVHKFLGVIWYDR